MYHVNVPNSRKTKYRDKSHVYVMIGVSEESKGYLFYDPMKEKIVVSQDVLKEDKKLSGNTYKRKGNNKSCWVALVMS